MDRRRFTARLGFLALAASGVVRAEATHRVYRIGVLSTGVTSDMAGPMPTASSMQALLQGMQELGYVYGKHFVTEPRGAAGNPGRFPALVAELVSLKVDVILAGGGPSVPALRQATATIPIVMAASADPVAFGYVKSLAHPGGNITGLSLQSTETTAKRLELLKQLVPGAKLFAVFWNGANALNLQAVEAIAREHGWRLLSVEINEPGEIEPAFRRARDARANAALVFAAGVLYPSPTSRGTRGQQSSPRCIRATAIRRRRRASFLRRKYH